MTFDELSARRAGRREANLRQLNERIAHAQQQSGSGDHALHLVCECSRERCEDGLVVPAGVFEELRSGDQRFVIAEGHVLQEVEHVVGQGDGWTIVEKIGPAARAAADELS